MPEPRTTATASEAPKGSRDNPLSLLDLPFIVPETGVYWLTVGNDKPMELPEAPRGSVLDVERRS